MPEREIPFEPPREYSPYEGDDDGSVAVQEAARAGVESPEKFKPIIDALQSVAKERNPSVVARMTQLIAERVPAGTLRPEDLAAIEQETASREELREKVFQILEKEHILSYGPEQEVIIDIQRLQLKKMEAGWGKFTDPFRNTKRFATYLEDGGGSVNLLLYAFEDESVISKEDWNRGEREGQPLFYSPASFNDACDPRKIRESRFYLGVHEVISRVNNAMRYPTGQNSFTLEEATVPLLIYHPRYGDGSRDTEGRLIVRWRDGSYRPITSRWFTKEMGYTGGSATKRTSLGTPKLFFEQEAPRLLERSVVRQSDFEAMTVGSTAERVGIQRSISGDGWVTIEGIRYFLGRQFDTKHRATMTTELVVYKISPTLGGVVEKNTRGEEHLTNIFDLVAYDDPRLKISNQGFRGAFKYAGRDVGNCRPYDPQEFHKRHPDEIEDAYRERMHAVDQFEVLLRLQRYLKKETGVNLHQLSLQEQQWLGALAAKDEKYLQRIGTFAEQYGLDGLRTFLSMEHDSAMGEQLFALGEQLEPDIARALFQKYGAIIDSAAQVRTLLQSSFGKQADAHLIERITESLLKRGSDFLAHFATQVHEHGAGKVEGEKILYTLEHFHTDALLFASTFKSALKENPTLQLETIGHMVVHTEDASRLLEEDRAEMQTIFSTNRDGKYPPRLLRAVKKDFDEAITKEGNELHLLKRGDTLLSFFRFERLPDGHVYLGSWNVRQEAQGSQLGNAMLGAALERIDAPMEAVVYEKNPVSLHVLEKFGFRVVGREDDYLGTGEAFFKLERPARKAEQRAVESAAPAAA